MSNMINIINNIDTEDLGEIMMDFAESLQLRGVNIVVCNISIEDLKNERFENIKKLDYYEYGDWDNLSYYVSDKEIYRIKKQFEEDLQDCLNNEESEAEDCTHIFSSFLYCNDNFDDESGYNFEYKDYVWGAMSSN